MGASKGWRLWGCVFPDPISRATAKAPPLTVSRTASLRDFPSALHLGTYFPDPISFDSAKRNGVGPPKKSAVLVLRCVPFNDRRIRAGYTKHPLPLPLHNAMFPCTHPNRLRLVCLAFPADAPSRCAAATGVDRSGHSVGSPVMRLVRRSRLFRF